MAGNEQPAADRDGISWRAARPRTSAGGDPGALGRVDFLEGLVAVAIDEVEHKKGQRSLTVGCDPSPLGWCGPPRAAARTPSTPSSTLGDRARGLRFVTCDGAEWIHTLVAERAPEATVGLATFHVIGWTTDALDEVRRGEWDALRRSGGPAAAKALKGLRWLLVRDWGRLTSAERGVIPDLERANRRMLRAWQLEDELRDIFATPLLAARRALDEWLARASRPRLAPFVKLARAIRRSRAPIEAAIDWRLTNGTPNPTTPPSGASAPTPAASTTPTPAPP